MFKKVLIANRGEIALRIIRTLRELDIRSVAVYSEIDANALHVKFADEAVCIGPAAAKDSYLSIPALLSAAEVTSAEAIHPGYGFLAENVEFAEVCKKCNIKWIGPNPEVMRIMGDKIAARQAMTKAGVPLLPGSGLLTDIKTVKNKANEIGFPVIIKAAMGGGGRGMKIVHHENDLEKAWLLARTEADLGFGSPNVYLEKYLAKPRHIEVQIVSDQHNNHIHLGERECSIQHRHQKLIEEAPAVSLSDSVRETLHTVALKAIASINYDSIGTMEFLYDKEQEQFYFMEMNTRLQVEHTVTEQVANVDLVREQLLISLGEKFSFQMPRKPRGHSIELRINAEHPTTFAPSPGRITGLNLPGGLGVRVDTHIYEQYTIPPHYDSLLAKLVVHDSSRKTAIARLKRCLDEFIIEGIHTNIPLFKRIVNDTDFQQGNINTHYLEHFFEKNKEV